MGLVIKDGKLVVRDGKLADGQGCCCGGCSGACPNGASDCSKGCGCKDGECVACSGACETSADCAEGCECVNGECVPSGTGCCRLPGGSCGAYDQESCSECTTTITCYETQSANCVYAALDENEQCPDGYTDIGGQCEKCTCPDGWSLEYGECVRNSTVGSCAECSGWCDSYQSGPCGTWLPTSTCIGGECSACPVCECDVDWPSRKEDIPGPVQHPICGYIYAQQREQIWYNFDPLYYYFPGEGYTFTPPPDDGCQTRWISEYYISGCGYWGNCQRRYKIKVIFRYVRKNCETNMLEDITSQVISGGPIPMIHEEDHSGGEQCMEYLPLYDMPALTDCNPLP